MTTIKCKKCEHDIEIPSESRNCLECGKPVIGSINAAIKESKMETKAILDNKAQAKKTIRALQKKTAKEINENGKIVNRKRKITFCFFTHCSSRSIFFNLTNFIIRGLLRKYLNILKTEIAPNKLPIQEKRKPLIIPCPATFKATIATSGNIGKKAST